MASLSASGAQSPSSSLSQQQQSYHRRHHHLQQQHTNGVYTGSPCAAASSIIVARNFIQHQRQCSTSSTCTTFTVATESNLGDVDNVSILSFSSGRHNECNNKVLHESDFSSPTSWEFRSDNCLCHHRLSSPCQSQYSQLKELRMPATAASASSPMVLPLSLPPQASSSSGGSSVSTTPSPLEEHGPGSSPYYPFPMQLSLLRGNKGTSPTTQAVLSVRNVSNSGSGNCSCVGLANSNHSTNTIVINGGDGGGGGGDEELLLSSHDLANGNGSDGSRNSTGSHRSQDSGFSDSGETRRRKSSNSGSVIINSPVAADITFSGNRTGSLSGAHVVNGSINHDHYLHPSQQNSINGHYQQQRMYNGNNVAVEYDCTNGSNSNYCAANSRSLSPNVHNVQGNCTPVVVNHLHNKHVYDHLSSASMPSPIAPSGFGCGRLISSPTHPPHHHIQQKSRGDNSPMYASVLVKRPTPPRRPASVDISTLDSNGNLHGVNGALPRRRSPSPSSPVATTCTDCLSSSINFHNQQQRHQRRSFSPPRSHDISALASSSTATAMAALQVPLSSSTPKRVPPSSSSSSSSRFSSNGNAIMVKIDNFETLNKNVNKDNNNNSSGNSRSASNTEVGLGKRGNKTFVIHSSSSQSKDSATSVPSIAPASNHQNSNGTVLVEEESQLEDRRYDSSNHREISQHNKQSTSSVASKGKTAAESIYDKICSRLSSFSSSTSSSSAAASPSVTTMENQTVVLHQKSSNCNKSLSLPPPSPHVESAAVNGSMDPFHCKASSQSSKSNISSNSKSIHTSAERETLEKHSSSSPSSSSLSKFKLFQRTSNGSQKSLSLPRGPSSTRLSIFEEVGVEVDSKSEEQAQYPEKSRCTSISTQTSPNEEAWKAIEQQVDSQVVRLWLHDLRTQTEPECLHSLQTKWILPADNMHDEEHDEDDEVDLESDAIPRSTTTAAESSRSISPATSSTITVGTMASTTTSGRHDLGSSSASSSVAHSSKYSHQHNQNHSSSKSMSPASEDYVIGPMVSSSVRFINSTSNHVKPSSSTSYVAKHRQRRSQQKFLSSMTAAIHAVSTPLMSIRNVETTANVISGEFSKICKHLEFGIFTQVPTLVLSLVGHIEDFLRGYHGQVRIPGVTYANLKKLEARLENACLALHMAAKSMNESALMISSSSDSGGSVSNPPPLPPRHSSSSSTPISSPDCLPGTSTKGYGCNGANAGDDPYLVLSSPSPLSSDPEPESLDMQQYHVVVGEVVEGIVTVGNLFSQVVDLRLTRDLASILDTIEGGGIPGRIALKSLVTVLADGGNHMCRLAADIRTVRGLLGVLLDTREDQDKILALRCLATVLCVGEAVKDFDKAGGFEIIADLLYDSAYSTWMKIEAVAVLTQATDPWIDLESTLMTLGVHLEKFIISLTKLIGEFKTEEEPFLLIVAAISNLTFLEVASTEYLKRCRTVSFLIDAVHGGNANFSVFVLDHVATILANMAGVESCRQEIIHCGGVDALLQFLQHRPSLPGKTDTVSAITACERLQQKSTIAISRLANEDGVARYVFDMGGVHRLVTLCRKEKERNFSDGVLIAALATLRKLVSICGDDAAKGLGGAEDLIEPRLLDSFLLYSSRQESYV